MNETSLARGIGLLLPSIDASHLLAEYLPGVQAESLDNVDLDSLNPGHGTPAAGARQHEIKPHLGTARRL